jgi:hypothetical protein
VEDRGHPGEMRPSTIFRTYGVNKIRRNEKPKKMSDYLKIPFKIFDRSDERGFSFFLDDLPLGNFHIVSLKPGKEGAIMSTTTLKLPA